jgi:glycosyltransferase involved in cell wall biosynthesis
MRVAIITNIPAPYRVQAWNDIAHQLKDNFLVLFCSHSEPNRNWNVPPIKFKHLFLKENYHEKSDGVTFVHNNPDVWKHLNNFHPDVVITGGFNPTMLYGFTYCLLKGKKHVPMSDAWEASERNLSFLHKLMRKVTYKMSHAFLACSQKGKAYFQSYGLKPDSVFISHYTINNPTPEQGRTFSERKYDLMFSGQFTERKNPLFFINVARRLQQWKPQLKILILGDGPMKEAILSELNKAKIDFDYPGYASQEELPGYYASARMFLFPTSFDAWGVVANEALNAGTPVLVTPFAGCSNELVIHKHNGYVLALDEEKWAEKCNQLLLDVPKWQAFSENAKQTTAQFTHQRAAKELIEACAYALKEEPK